MGRARVKLNSIFKEGQPVIFLGIADFMEFAGAPFPMGSIDLYRLSRHKSHIVYPASVQSNFWILLVSNEFLETAALSEWELRIEDENGCEFGNAKITSNPSDEKRLTQSEIEARGDVVAVVKDSQFTLFPIQIDGVISRPGKYTISLRYKKSVVPIGTVEFHYSKAPSLTPDKIKALESAPDAAKSILMTLGCKSCPAKLKVYTGFGRSTKLEREGCVWHTELKDEFICDCGSTKHPLQYLRESMHGLLLKDFSANLSGLNYVRRYSHSQVEKTVNDFTELLDAERLEAPIQKFIEEHPILLSRFHAKRIFFRKSIVDKFKTDFAIVDTQNRLWLIELEKPSLKLFKKNSHPYQELMHAYEQVNDWFDQYDKYPQAILDTLGLKSADVVSLRGAVIAGRSRDVTHDTLQRHLSNPPYPNIEFMTCDDLATSLLEISKRLA